MRGSKTENLLYCSKGCKYVYALQTAVRKIIVGRLHISTIIVNNFQAGDKLPNNKQCPF